MGKRKCICDMCGKKGCMDISKSLKKFAIEFGIHHQELPIPWDESVDKEVSEYCENDVIAAETVMKEWIY